MNKQTKKINEEVKKLACGIFQEHMKLVNENTKEHTCKYCKHFIWSAFFCDEGKCWQRSYEGDFRSYEGEDCKYYEFGEPGKFVECDDETNEVMK